MKRHIVLAVVGGTAAVVSLIHWWPRQPSAGTSGIDLARAWAAGDVETIYRFCPPFEREQLTFDQLNQIYEDFVLKHLRGLRLLSVRESEVDDEVGTSRTGYDAEFLTGTGTTVRTTFTVYANRERIWSGAVFGLRLLAASYVRDREGGDVVSASLRAGEALNPILSNAGIRQWASPRDGKLHAIPTNDH